jgi:glycosyltransferase involved in cell wall biosynthesis
VATVPFAIKILLRPHIAKLKVSYDLTLVSSGTATDVADVLGDHVLFTPLHIKRKVSLMNDLFSLIRLWRLFRKERFDCVYSIKPKSGLLSMLAARAAGVPLRFHAFTGQVWATRRGIRRFVLKSLDKILAMNATLVFADSHAQRLFLIENKVVKSEQIIVLAEGSIAGVNLDRFKYDDSKRQQIRLDNQIPEDAIVFLFMGRLNRDKGLVELARAFALAGEKIANIHLYVVGPDEEGLEAEFDELGKRFPGRMHRTVFTDYPEAYMSAADVLCLPSHREGFPAVIIEAAAVGLPVIASRIYGIIDTVQEGVTGILHHPASVQELVEAMLKLCVDDKLRRQMGEAARKRVVDRFSEARVTQAMTDFFQQMFARTKQ